jgi:phosphomannomutase
MSAFFAFLLFSIICVGSLLVVSWANHVETRRRLVGNKLRQLKTNYEELQQVITSVDQLVEPREITRLLCEESLSLANSMSELDPEDGYVIAAVSNASALLEEVSKDEDRRIYRIRESDSQIALAQQHLEQASTVLGKKQALGHISPEELNSFRTAMAWAKIMLQVLSYVAQGHQAMSRQEILPGRGFYQKAKGVITQSPHPDKRRTKLIRELKEILDGNRAAVSEDIMPETDFNPKEPFTHEPTEADGQQVQAESSASSNTG